MGNLIILSNSYVKSTSRYYNIRIFAEIYQIWNILSSLSFVPRFQLQRRSANTYIDLVEIHLGIIGYYLPFNCSFDNSYSGLRCLSFYSESLNLQIFIIIVIYLCIIDIYCQFFHLYSSMTWN